MEVSMIDAAVLLVAVFLLVAEFVSKVERDDQRRAEEHRRKKEIELEALAYSFLKTQTKNLRHAVEEFENAIEEIEPRK